MPVQVRSVHLIDKAGRGGRHDLPVLVAGGGVRDERPFLCPRHRHVEQPPLLLQPLRCRDALLRREKLLLHARDKNIRELQPFGGMHRHQRHLVSVPLLLPVLVRE